jgi:plastocyanin
MVVFRVAATVAFLALSPASAQAQPSTPVQIVDLVNYSYSPEPLVLHAGSPVTLRFVNRSKSGHDFTAAKFFGSARILAGLVRNGEVEVRPHQIASVTLIPAAGRYTVYCSHPFHKILGMHTTIVVQ